MSKAAGPPSASQIRLARQRLGMTQTEFARLLGVARQGTVSAWETGDATPLISAERMEELVMTHGAPRAGGYLLDPVSYSLGALVNVADDARLIADAAARIVTKVADAARTLGAVTPPSASAIGRGAVQGAAAPQARRRRKGRGE